MDYETDVAIIGGGATGTGIARDLSLRGLDVTLVERNGLADGTSGRSHGLLHSGARYAESDKRGAKECIHENEIIRNIAGSCIKDTSGLFVKLKTDNEDYFQEKIQACRDVGIPTTILDGNEVLNRHPQLTEEIDKAFTVPDAAIYPSRIVAANAESAAQNGADIHTHTDVTDIITEDGTAHGITCDGNFTGDIHADYIINSTGAWAERVADTANLHVPMKPTKGVMVSVDYPELDVVVNRCRETDDGDIAIPHEQQVVLGTTSIEVDDPDKYPKKDWEIDRMYDECGDMIPDIHDAELERTYWGVRPLYAPDELDRSNNDSNTGDGRSISRGFQLLDHTSDGIEGMCSVVGGKLTTYRLMAEETSDFVCNQLNTNTECQTDTTPLPGHNSSDAVDEFVAKYDATSPADEDVVTV